MENLDGLGTPGISPEERRDSWVEGVGEKRVSNPENSGGHSVEEATGSPPPALSVTPSRRYSVCGSCQHGTVS
jgi:hypothetical protein